MSERPRIVCLCGSSRFHETHARVSMVETLAGKIVVGMGLFGHADEPAGARRLTDDPETKRNLDRLHLAEIDLADEVLVLNVGGYVGESTRMEIAHAVASGKEVRWLETPR